MDDISNERLNLVHPLLAEKIRRMAEVLSLDNPPITFRVTQGLRSWNDQERLYAQGRTAPGKVVTNAAPGHSYHQFGLAVDLVPLNVDGSADWNPEHPIWKRLIEVGVSLGLESGSQWRTFKDYPHFQLTGTLPVSPTDEVRQIFKDSGTVSVWKEAFPDYAA